MKRHTASSITDDALDALYANANEGWRRGDRWKKRAEVAEAAVERVREALAPYDWQHAQVSAARVRAALPEQTAPATPDAEATARMFAALHRSAEEDVTRVIDLYEQWVKAGPPPLGTSLARWWDARLAELHTAIRQPADQPEESTTP